MRAAGRFVIACLALVGTACGVRLQHEPEHVPQRDVSYGLLDPRDPEVNETSASFVVYFQRGAVLVAVPRVATTPATPEAVVDALLRGPTIGEAAAGLQTSIPEGTALLAIERDGRVVTMSFSTNFRDAPDLAAALRQLDATLRDLPGVEVVRILVDGVEVAPSV